MARRGCWMCCRGHPGTFPGRSTGPSPASSLAEGWEGIRSTCSSALFLLWVFVASLVASLSRGPGGPLSANTFTCSTRWIGGTTSRSSYVVAGIPLCFCYVGMELYRLTFWHLHKVLVHLMSLILASGNHYIGLFSSRRWSMRRAVLSNVLDSGPLDWQAMHQSASCMGT